MIFHALKFSANTLSVKMRKEGGMKKRIFAGHSFWVCCPLNFVIVCRRLLNAVPHTNLDYSACVVNNFLTFVCDSLRIAEDSHLK